MNIALELKKVHKNFGETQIIRGVDLDIQKGECHAIIGPNGAGKSTLFNLISGGFRVSQGSIVLNGRDITKCQPFEINRQGLSRSFQVTNLFAQMSVFENVRNGLLYHSGCRYSFWERVQKKKELSERTNLILEQIGLFPKRKLPASVLPYADLRALEIGVTIAGGAHTVLLDEPTSGMSHVETQRAVELIRTIAHNRTILVVEHDMGVVFDLADRISVLVYGKIIASDCPENIRSNKEVRDAYLGTEF